MSLAWLAKWRARSRVEKIDRNGLDLELPQLERQSDPVLGAFTHPHDAAAARFHARGLDRADGADPVIVAVGGADLGEVGAGAFQVVVEPGHAGRGELLRLALRQEPKGGADIDVEVRLDAPDRSADHVQLLLRRSSGAGHHAVLDRADRRRLAGPLVQLVYREHLVAVDSGVKPGRLAAEGTVLRAQSALGVLQDVDPDVASVIPLPHPERGMEDAEQLVIVRVEYGERIGPLRLRTGEGAVGQLIPIHYRASGDEVCGISRFTDLGSRGGRRVEQQDLLYRAYPGRVLEGEQIVHLIVRAGERADRAAGSRALTDAHGGLLDQPDFPDLLHAHRAQGVGLAEHQRVALQAHQPDVPDVLPVLQSDLPPVVRRLAACPAPASRRDTARARPAAARSGKPSFPPGKALSFPRGGPTFGSAEGVAQLVEQETFNL